MRYLLSSSRITGTIVTIQDLRVGLRQDLIRLVCQNIVVCQGGGVSIKSIPTNMDTSQETLACEWTSLALDWNK